MTRDEYKLWFQGELMRTGKTRLQVAEHLGLPYSTFCGKLNGYHSFFDLSQLLKIRQFLQENKVPEKSLDTGATL